MSTHDIRGRAGAGDEFVDLGSGSIEYRDLVASIGDVRGQILAHDG